VIEIKYKDQDFKFRTEETISDRMKIESEAVKLAGGYLQLADLKTAVEQGLNRLIETNKNRFGVEDYLKKNTRLRELHEQQETQSEEYQNIFKNLNDNPNFYSYLNLLNEKDSVYSYARLFVLCNQKPDGYNFYDQSEEDLKGIISQLELQKVFFRR